MEEAKSGEAAALANRPVAAPAGVSGEAAAPAKEPVATKAAVPAASRSAGDVITAAERRAATETEAADPLLAAAATPKKEEADKGVARGLCGTALVSRAARRRAKHQSRTLRANVRTRLGRMAWP